MSRKHFEALAKSLGNALYGNGRVSELEAATIARSVARDLTEVAPNLLIHKFEEAVVAAFRGLR